MTHSGGFGTDAWKVRVRDVDVQWDGSRWFIRYKIAKKQSWFYAWTKGGYLGDLLFPSEEEALKARAVEFAKEVLTAVGEFSESAKRLGMTPAQIGLPKLPESEE